MTRQHPFFSPLGCLGGAVLIAGLVIAVVLSGGAMFSPGELTAYAVNDRPVQGFRSHADFQQDCRQCHAPFLGIATDRCEGCHTSVRDERATATGLHGHLDVALAARCGECHDDHEGPDHDPSALAIRKFDHASTGFALARHIINFDETALECRACHSVPGYTFLLARCADCHSAAEADFLTGHQTAFGGACLDCHDGVDRTATFDHSQTALALEGRHAQLECAACHSASTPPVQTPAECAGCHTAPDTHAGALNGDCADCHAAAAWKPANLPDHPGFDHAQTLFQLVNHTVGYDGAPLTCAACHAVPAFAFNPERCVACHAAQDAVFMDAHVQQYGQQCANCHDGAGNLLNFDHNLVFPLDGAHAPLECAACHAEQRFRGTPNQCAACHQEPTVHAGLFGQQCAACHSTSAWAPAQLTQHVFPLDHGEEGEIPCGTCHENTYTAYTCFNCHAHDPNETRSEHDEVNLAGQALENCAACHANGQKEEEREHEGD